MQFIDIVIEDEKHNLIEKSNINFIDVFLKIEESQSGLYPFLESIDSGGDTTFNRLQIPKVIDELEKLSVQVPQEISHRIKDVVAFMRKTEDNPHSYIKFIGD